MTEASKQWVGQIVEGIFPLRQYLGGSDHSAVFLTECGKGESQKAAIKLVPADPATADAQLSRWNFAAQLSHPNLLRLFGTGRCRLGGNDLLYVVMEFAEENLSQILPERALTTDETREMLCAVLDALEYLHGKGFVHGDLKPANILASGEHLKLSSDAISRAGETQGTSRRTGVYDPPEAISGMLTSATDVWSLGTTLVEVLTRRLPDWQPGSHREPVVPETIQAPYQEIARQCLRLEPQRRISVSDIAARLNSRVAVALASASALGSNPSPLAGSVAPAVPKPVASLPLPPKAAARLQTNPHRSPPYRESRARSRFIVPLTVGALAFALILTVPRLLTHHPEAQSTPTVTSVEPSGQPNVKKAVASTASPKSAAKSEREPAVSETARPAAPEAQQPAAQSPQPKEPDALKTTSEKEQPSPVSATATAPASAEAAKPVEAGMVSAKGEVLDQVLPDVSQKARDTIRGKVRVGIKVQVDPSGGVSGAELDSPGPSAFFADLALKAARRWAFTPPEVNGKSVASEWRLKFEFTQQDTKVTPTQTAP
jgi:TonB family protein